MLSKNYFIAGDAVFTLDIPGDFRAKNPDVKPHYTYRVFHKEANGQWPESWFVSLLTGPDNTASYTYLGKLHPKTGAVALTPGSKFTEEAWPVRLVRRSMARIFADQSEEIEKAGFRLMHDGRCSMCGRPLTTPESLDRGLGPICAARF